MVLNAVPTQFEPTVSVSHIFIAPNGELRKSTESANQRLGLETLSTPDSIGRFKIKEKIGRGGMGQVYLAFDPKLRRDVAIKFVPCSALGSELVLAEARALAQLTHKNVVTVHETGELEGGVYIVMSYIAGITFREWSKQQRSWREVVRAIAQVGAGISAAHKNGIIHADIKPDNILMDPEAGAIIIDFGLATGKNEKVMGSPSGSDALHGTIGYIAPERFEGKEATHLSDQYALAVTTFEAVFGRRPQSESGRLVAEKQGAAPDFSKAPRHLRTILGKALHSNPEKRFGSVRSFCEALETAAARKKVLFASLVVIGIAGTAIAGTYYTAKSDEVPCGSEEAFTDSWNTRLQNQLSNSWKDFPEERKMVLKELNRFKSRWVSDHQSVCMATKKGNQSTMLLDQRMACLASTRYQFDGLVREVIANPADLRFKATTATSKLIASEHCPSQKLVGEAYTIDNNQKQLVEESRKALDDARNFDRLSLFDDAKKKYEEAVTLAEQSGNEVTIARTYFHQALRRGWLTDETDMSQLEKAISAATKAKQDDLVALSMIRMAELATNKGDLPAGKRNLDNAKLWLTRGDASTSDRGSYHIALSEWYEDSDKFAQATEQASKAIEVYKNSPDDWFEYTRALDRITALQGRAGDWKQALKSRKESLKIKQDRLGENHPSTAGTISNLGNTYFYGEQYEEAYAHQDRARKIFTGIYGERHQRVAMCWYGMGTVQLALDKNEEALASLKMAHSIYKETLPNGHPHLQAAINALAGTYANLGKTEKGIAMYLELLNMRIEKYGANHSKVARLHSNLAITFQEAKDFDQAKKHWDAYLRIAETTEGAQRWQLAKAHFGLGEWARVSQQNPCISAVPHYRKAEETFQELKLDKQKYALSSSMYIAECISKSSPKQARARFQKLHAVSPKPHGFEESRMLISYGRLEKNRNPSLALKLAKEALGAAGENKELQGFANELIKQLDRAN